MFSLSHFFLPHAKNNHRAKILHNSSLFAILLFFIFATIGAYLFKVSKPDVLGVSYSISEGDLLTLVNQQRQQNGESVLSIDPELDNAAREKAADMFAKNYWAHFAPDGSTSPWGFIKDSGYSYIFAGENLAKGFTDSQSVVTAWMNSPTHRDNLLSPRYHDVGFAIVPGTLQGEDTVLVVQMFGARQTPEMAKISEESAVAPVMNNVSSPSSGVVLSASPQPAQPQVPSGSQSAVIVKPVIDAQISSSAASTVGLSFLGFALVMDLLIVERKRIPRVVGHNIDHIILILLFILFIILKSRGVIA